MKKKTSNKWWDKLSEISGDFGRGLFSGLAGTIAISFSQWIEMKITHRPPSNSPVEAAGEVLGFIPKDEKHKKSLNGLVHYTYGSLWGVVKGIFTDMGVNKNVATFIQFISLWGTELVMLPSLNKSTPVYKWSSKEIWKDVLHHTVYSIASGFVYDLLKKHSGSYSSNS
jgi:hypothetical protein